MGALTGLKILDFSALLPGPLGTMFLADLGADVVSVSAPGKPDLMNAYAPHLEGGISATAAWLGRNKKSITLDLKKPEAVAVVKKMIKEYDVVLEQFRPGVMKKLGLDYETLKKENSALIYCSLSGYGQNGPLQNKVGHDINYVALSGNMQMMGTENPPRVSVPNFHLADIAGGGYMTPLAILAAVYYREKTGKGQYIDMGMMDSILPFNCVEGCGVLAARDYPDGWKNETISGVKNGPHYDVYETADHKYMSVGPLEPKFYANLCKALGFDDWADMKIIYADPKVFRSAIAKKIKEKTRAEWCNIFDDVEACVEPVYDVYETWQSPQVVARNMVAKVPVSLEPSKTVDQIANPIKMSETPAEYKHSGYPAGYCNKDVLSKFGLSDEEIDYVSNK